jgi:molybdenum cofactor cytidylyltransferase
VALAPDRPERAALLRDLPVRTVTVEDAAEGMGASLRAAVQDAPEGVPLIVALADMPDIAAADHEALLTAFEDQGGDTVVRAAAEDGRPGQPVFFPGRLRARLMSLTGDTGGREILKDEHVVLVPLPGLRALVDLDTPDDFAQWRGRS